MRRRFAHARVARLATVGADGRPHLVPICFALVDDRIISVVDHKPKTTTNLRRLANIRANPAVTLLVDHWDEDWSTLWWIRVDGQATVVDEPAKPGTVFESLLLELHGKYRGSYGRHAFDGPAIVIDAQRWTGWSAGDSATPPLTTP